MIHANSLAAYASLDLDPREREIIDALSILGIASAREIMRHLKYTEMNQVRPRITELLERGIIRECGAHKCPETGHRCMLVEIAP